MEREHPRDTCSGEMPHVKKQKVQKNISEEPVHGKRPLLKALLTWKVKNYEKHVYGTFPFDLDCTEAILSKEIVKKYKIQVYWQKNHLIIYNAQGDLMRGAGEYFTDRLEMIIGMHKEDISWEVATLEKVIAGYLPISYIQKHNPDIN